MYEENIVTSLACRYPAVEIDEIALIVKHFLPPISAPGSVHRNASQATAKSAEHWDRKFLIAFNDGKKEEAIRADNLADIFREVSRLADVEAKLKDY